MKRFKLFGFAILAYTFVLSGCVPQPERINNTLQPQVEMTIEHFDTLQDKIVNLMAAQDYYIVSVSKYALDFRKNFGPNEDTFARAVMMSMDNSNIDSRGVDFYIIPMQNKILIKAKPYLYKTFSYNRMPSEKLDMSNNSNYYNRIQTILNELKLQLEDRRQ